VEELGGLIFAYLGPEPAPLLPRYDLLVWDNVMRHVGVTMIPCNWVQCMENSMDPVHVEWLHGVYLDYVWARKGQPTAQRNAGRHKKIGFDRFEHGIVKRRVVEGQTEEDDAWRVGHPVVFPNILRSGTGFQYRVPVDDSHTYHLIYQVYQTGLPMPPQAAVPVYEIPLLDTDGRYMNEILLVQDFFAWASQGPIARRELERLGQSDIGIIMYRELLKEQIEAVARGEDPLEVYRDPSQNRCIDIPQEAIAATYTSRTAMAMSGRIALGSAYERFSPMRAQLLALYQEAEARIARGEPVLGIPETPPVPIGAHHKQVTILPQS
jgi:5,5'-dehydrodivanillate O-demethylase